MYRDSRWARKILTAQGGDGLSGIFRTLSQPGREPLPTEQALRRLKILGLTVEDEPIEKAVTLMSDCLRGRKVMPDRREGGNPPLQPGGKPLRQGFHSVVDTPGGVITSPR